MEDIMDLRRQSSGLLLAAGLWHCSHTNDAPLAAQQTTQFRLTGCSSPYWESQLHLEQGEPAASATSLQFQPSASLTLYPGYQTREVFLHLPF